LGTLASKTAPTSAIGWSIALRKKTSLQQKAFTCANSAGSAWENPSPAAKQRPSRCTMISATSIDCVLGGAQCVRQFNGNLRDRTPGRKQPHGRACRILEGTKTQPPHRSVQNQARLCRTFPLLWMLLAEVVKRVQSRCRFDDGKLKDVLVSLGQWASFSGSQEFPMRRKEGPRARTIFGLEIAGRPYIGELGDVQGSRLCQARHHCPEFRPLVECIHIPLSGRYLNEPPRIRHARAAQSIIATITTIALLDRLKKNKTPWSADREKRK